MGCLSYLSFWMISSFGIGGVCLNKTIMYCAFVDVGFRQQHFLAFGVGFDLLA
jgi:hypothetical protein